MARLQQGRELIERGYDEEPNAAYYVLNVIYSAVWAATVAHSV